ncbi:FeoB-associated Cys-rich membrane protein [candidate division KSB1 bacterium]|nr:FeoB-associated Cys-rich membrane protein [candidate division KSB1 bacterium]
MWQYIIVFAALILAILFLVRYYYRKFQETGCSDACCDCPFNQKTYCAKYEKSRESVVPGKHTGNDTQR